MNDTAEQIAAGLRRDMRDLLLECRPDWFRADELTWSRPGPTGNSLCRLSERGLLERATDELKWGRGKYRLTALGLQVRAILERQS